MAFPHVWKWTNLQQINTWQNWNKSTPEEKLASCDICAHLRVCTLVMCVVVVVHRDSEVIVWAVINTPGSPSLLPSNWQREETREENELEVASRSNTHALTQRHTHTQRNIPAALLLGGKLLWNAACNTKKNKLYKWKPKTTVNWNCARAQTAMRGLVRATQKRKVSPCVSKRAPVQPRMWWSWFPCERWALLLWLSQFSGRQTCLILSPFLS